MKMEETANSIYYPMIIIEANGKRINSNGSEKLPAGTVIISDYKKWREMSKYAGIGAFKIITRIGNLLYCIKKEQAHAHYQLTNCTHPHWVGNN